MIANKMKSDELPIKGQCWCCVYMKAVVSWWCTNKEAIEQRETSLPTATHCKFWEPAP